jgi:hypothetical protein
MVSEALKPASALHAPGQNMGSIPKLQVHFSRPML